MTHWRGNGYGRWAACLRRALRLVYFPYCGHTAEHETSVKRIREKHRHDTARSMRSSKPKQEKKKNNNKNNNRPKATEARWPEGPQTPSGPSASGDPTTQMNAGLQDMAETAEELSRQDKKLFWSSQATKT